METSQIALTPLFSTLEGDPDLAELLASFVAEIPQRISRIQACADQGDWREAAQEAHQFQGTAGSYGFTELQRRLGDFHEAVVSGAELDQVLADLDQVRRVAGRVRTGRALD